MSGQQGFWDIENRLAELSAEGDPLEKLSATVDFEVFRPILLRALRQAGPLRLGRPPFCPVLKFRMLDRVDEFVPVEIFGIPSLNQA